MIKKQELQIDRNWGILRGVWVVEIENGPFDPTQKFITTNQEGYKVIDLDQVYLSTLEIRLRCPDKANLTCYPITGKANPTFFISLEVKISSSHPSHLQEIIQCFVANGFQPPRIEG